MQNSVLYKRYRLLELLGKGGFSEVWKALDEKTATTVAVKIFNKQDEEGIMLCRMEYRKTHDLKHPNILAPYFFDDDNGTPFLVMPYCELGTAAQRIGQMDGPALEKLFLHMAGALAYMHNKTNPIVHNDIKPDNILVNADGDYMLTDFGISDKLQSKLTQTISRAQMEEESRRHSGITPLAYRAPELFSYKAKPKGESTNATDVWALGVSAYQLASGLLPFHGEGGLAQLIAMHSSSAELDDLVPDLPPQFSPRLSGLVKKCLALNTFDRPTAQQLLDALEGGKARGTAVTGGRWPDGGLPNVPDAGNVVLQGRQAGSSWAKYLPVLLVLVLLFAVVELVLVFMPEKRWKPADGENVQPSGMEVDSVSDGIREMTDSLPYWANPDFLVDAAADTADTDRDLDETDLAEKEFRGGKGVLLDGGGGIPEAKASPPQPRSDMVGNGRFQADRQGGIAGVSKAAEKVPATGGVGDVSAYYRAAPTTPILPDVETEADAKVEKKEEKEEDTGLVAEMADKPDEATFSFPKARSFLNFSRSLSLGVEKNIDIKEDAEVRFRLQSPLEYGGFVLLPAGTELLGKVAKVTVPGGVFQGKTVVRVDFNGIALPGGVVIDLQDTNMLTKHNEGELYFYANQTYSVSIRGRREEAFKKFVLSLAE